MNAEFTAYVKATKDMLELIQANEDLFRSTPDNADVRASLLKRVEELLKDA